MPFNNIEITLNIEGITFLVMISYNYFFSFLSIYQKMIWNFGPIITMSILLFLNKGNKKTQLKKKQERTNFIKLTESYPYL